MSRLYPDWKKEFGNTNNIIPQIINCDTANLHTQYKGDISLFDASNSTKNNFLNNLPLHTQSNGKTTEARLENMPLETHKMSSLTLSNMQLSSENAIQNKLNMTPKPFQIRRKLFEDILVTDTTSDEHLYQHSYKSPYESFKPTKLEGYIAPEQNYTESNITHNGKMGDFEMDQNTSDLLSATLSDDTTIQKEAKSDDFSHPNVAYSPFVNTNRRYSEVNNNEHKYTKSTLFPRSYSPPSVRKPLARTSSFNFPSKPNQENDKYKTSLLTRRPSLLTDNTLPVNGLLNRNIRNYSFPKSLINENSALDSKFKKYLMDTERPYNTKDTYDPREVLRYNELTKKAQDGEYIKPDVSQKVRSYDNRSVHFESSSSLEDEKLKDSENSYNKYMNRFSKQLNSVRNSEPIWQEALKINDTMKPDSCQILNSTTEDNNFQDEKNKSIFNFQTSNSKAVPQRQPVGQDSFSNPSFVLTEYKSPNYARDDKCSTLEDTEVLSHPVKPNKGKLQEISQEECMQFPKEKILEQFPEHTSEQFYRLQVVAENPQEQVDELNTNDGTFQSKLFPDYKHNSSKTLQNINKNGNFEHVYDSDTNNKYKNQADHVNKNAYNTKEQSSSLSIPTSNSRTDNKFYEDAIKQLRIEAQKSDSLLENNNLVEQEPNRDKTVLNSIMHETKSLEPENISKTMIQEERISIINCSGSEEKGLVSNTLQNNGNSINKTDESPHKNTDNQLDFLRNNEAYSEEVENELFKLKRTVKSNNSENNSTNSENFNDTNDLRSMKQLLPTQNDIKSGSGSVKKYVPINDNPKNKVNSDNVKLTTVENKVDSENSSLNYVDNTSNKTLLEETQDTEHKISKTDENPIQFIKDSEINPAVNKAVTENNTQITVKSGEFPTADNKEFTENSTESKNEPSMNNNEEDRVENVIASGEVQENKDKINENEGDVDNNEQNINNDQYPAHDGNVSSQNQDYSGIKEHQNEELTVNAGEHLDGLEQVLYSTEHEQVSDNITQQYSDDKMLKNDEDLKNNVVSVAGEQLDDESKNYENYYPEVTGFQDGNDYVNQQYYADQQQEFYPDQNVEGLEYTNYNNLSSDQYKPYDDENNETAQYVSNQYENTSNYQYEHNDKNEYEQEQENYEGEFDDRTAYTQQHYDNRQQYDQEEGNYQDQYNNEEQYEQQGVYNVKQYEHEGSYSTDHYEQQDGNYQHTYEDSEHYTQQEGDYQHTYHENQYEEGNYNKNYENENQYEQQEREYNQSRYEPQEGDYQQNYNERDEFHQQGDYDQNYNQYEQYDLPKESDYRSSMQPSDNLQESGRFISVS